MVLSFLTSEKISLCFQTVEFCIPIDNKQGGLVARGGGEGGKSWVCVVWSGERDEGECQGIIRAPLKKNGNDPQPTKGRGESGA